MVELVHDVGQIYNQLQVNCSYLASISSLKYALRKLSISLPRTVLVFALLLRQVEKSMGKVRRLRLFYNCVNDSLKKTRIILEKFLTTSGCGMDYLNLSSTHLRN